MGLILELTRCTRMHLPLRFAIIKHTPSAVTHASLEAFGLMCPVSKVRAVLDNLIYTADANIQACQRTAKPHPYAQGCDLS